MTKKHVILGAGLLVIGIFIGYYYSIQSIARQVTGPILQPKASNAMMAEAGGDELVLVCSWIYLGGVRIATGCHYEVFNPN